MFLVEHSQRKSSKRCFPAPSSDSEKVEKFHVKCMDSVGCFFNENKQYITHLMQEQTAEQGRIGIGADTSLSLHGVEEKTLDRLTDEQYVCSGTSCEQESSETKPSNPNSETKPFNPNSKSNSKTRGI